MANTDEYIHELIENETDARYCAQLLVDEFSSSNDLVIFSEGTPEILFNIWTWPLMQDSFNHGLAFLTRHKPSNEIVATMAAQDLYLTMQKKQIQASDNPMVDLSEEILDEFIEQDFNRELKENMVLLLLAGATRPQHLNKGVVTQLSQFTCHYAQEKRGFQYVFVQTSHPATRHICLNKMGGKELRKLDPATWQWKKNDGSYPAKDYRGEPLTSIFFELKPNQENS